LNRVRRQLRRETIQQEPSADQKKKEKAFIATDKTGGMIGVISAPAPEKAAAKIFLQKFRGETEITGEKPLEIYIRDLGAGTNYRFMIWTEISESTGDTDDKKDDKREEKKAVKKLIVRKVS
jgi:DEAD/DEAH box helicase domain-containing protein